MSQCNCVNAGLPRDVIDLITPVFEAVGGRLYRLHFETKASAIKLTDGQDVETRLAFFERALAGNTTIRFADTIAARDALGGLVPGDLCYVFDATADKSVAFGGAMYIWLPVLSWKKCFNGDSPIDALNMIREKGGLAVDAGGKVYVDFSLMPQADLGKLLAQIIGSSSGLETGPDGKLHVRPGDIAGSGLQTDANGKLTIKPSDIAGNGLQASGGKLAVNPSDLAGAGLAVDGAKLKVDFGQATAAQLQAIAQGLIQNGGGLDIDAAGRLFVNYDTMPTDKFDNLLEVFRKGLRLPKWLTAKKNFTVDKNHAAASDALDEGRGSAALPFASIQACANYVAQNFNVANYIAEIRVAGGEYAEKLSLTEFQRGTGYIRIRPASADDVVTLVHNFTTEVNSSAINCTGGLWHIDGIDIVNTLTEDNSTSSANKYRYMITTSQGADLYLTGCRISLNSALLPIGSLLQQWLLFANGGIINLTSKSSLKNRTSEINVAAGSVGDSKRVFGLGASAGGIYRAIGSNVADEDRNFAVSGAFTTFCQMGGGRYQSGGFFTWPLKFVPNPTVTGKRYEALNGGTINTGSNNPDYFPGDQPGTVEAEICSWYK